MSSCSSDVCFFHNFVYSCCDIFIIIAAIYCLGVGVILLVVESYYDYGSYGIQVLFGIGAILVAVPVVLTMALILKKFCEGNLINQEQDAEATSRLSQLSRNSSQQIWHTQTSSTVCNIEAKSEVQKVDDSLPTYEEVIKGQRTSKREMNFNSNSYSI